MKRQCERKMRFSKLVVKMDECKKINKFKIQGCNGTQINLKLHFPVVIMANADKPELEDP